MKESEVKTRKSATKLASNEDCDDVQDPGSLPRRGRPQLKRFKPHRELVKKSVSGYLRKEHNRKC